MCTYHTTIARLGEVLPLVEADSTRTPKLIEENKESYQIFEWRAHGISSCGPKEEMRLIL
jgi:hypothetical protein